MSVAFDLRDDAPETVLSVLRRLADPASSLPADLDGFPLSDDGDWALDMFDAAPLVRFPGHAGARFGQEYRHDRPADQGGEPVHKWAFTGRAILHDDVAALGPEFLQWVAPHSDSAGFVGYIRSDHEWDPVLVYFEGGKDYYLDLSKLDWGIGAIRQLGLWGAAQSAEPPRVQKAGGRGRSARWPFRS